MKYLRICIMFGLLTCLGTRAQAELVTFTLTLDAPSAAANRLSLSLLGGNTTSDLSGTFDARVEFNRTTGVVSNLELLFSTVPTITSTNWTLNAAPPVGPVNGNNIVASMDTSVPTSTVTAGTFPASEQQLRLIGGTVTAPAIGFSDTFLPTDSVDIPGLDPPGVGTITSTFNPGANAFDLVFALPINNSQTIAAGADLQITGNVVGRGQISVVPEPGSALLLMVSAAGIAFGRRRWVSMSPN